MIIYNYVFLYLRYTTRLIFGDIGNISQKYYHINYIIFWIYLYRSNIVITKDREKLNARILVSRDR